jgi:predicted O-linked N-acetylglucosamine transferase (SPINDLY family)
MLPLTISDALELAIGHHGAGRLAEAEALYRQVLAAQPNHAEAHHLLGVIAQQCGRADVAAELIRRAIELGLRTASAHSNLGEAYRRTGRLDDAIAAYRSALDLQSDFEVVHFNLGGALMEKGRLDDALVALRRAVELEPGHAEAHGNLGACHAELGRYEDAIAAYRRALQLKPALAETEFNLGVALTRLGRIEEAAGAYRRAAELRPGYAEAYLNLGAALADLGQAREAVAALSKAVELQPDYAQAYFNLGNALRDDGRPDEAMAAYRRAIELEPDYADAHNNLGNTCRATGWLEDAVAAFRRAAQCPGASTAMQSNVINTLHLLPGNHAREIAEEQARWNRQFGDPVKHGIEPHTNERDPERRLRIGYISPDLWNHTVGRNLMPLFRSHDRTRFEIFCYSDVAHPDHLTEEIRAHADGWREVIGMADEELARTIREDRIDILVDLALHTARNRLPVFAREPAPVQVSFAGYPGSTGVEAIRHRISDAYLEAGVAGTPAERVHLIDSFWCYDPCGMDLAVNELPARESRRVTFGSVNSFAKVNEAVLKLWARVLSAVVDSRLIVLSPEGRHRQRVLDILREGGVEGSRVEFFKNRPRREYLELYHRVDVMLDPFPYGGHTTSLDALWMGVPVVSLAGEQIVSRAGLSQLSNLGLRELVAFSEEEYVRIAAELAGDVSRLGELRATLRSRLEKSVLMDGERFARGIEGAYREMWREWCGEE